MAHFYQEPHNHNFKPHVDVSDNDLLTLAYAVFSNVEAHWLSAESFPCLYLKKKDYLAGVDADTLNPPSG